jgi:hypothetical protein
MMRTVDVYLDSAPENFTPELALRAEGLLDESAGGWLRPLATADAFGAFLDAWRRNDPNGIWGYVSEVGDSLVLSRIDDDEPNDVFPLAGQTADGTPLYDLSGWAWVAAQHEG